ncbi:MAG: 50S ribosomal protein L11 methyltransferase [Verrucomicrobiota bacterium]
MFVWSKLSAVKWMDAWEERFSGNPALHLVITTIPGQVRVRVEIYAEKKKDVLTVQKEWGGSVREVKQQNWAALSKEPMPSIAVRGKLVVVSARSAKDVAKEKKANPGKEVVAIPADMAFGTGHHATTATVLRMLVDAAKEVEGQKWTMADLGCGSGILAIAAVKLGASKAWGCDFDPKAVLVSKENATRNDASKIRFTEVDVLEWEPKQQWDVVAANIFVDILEQAFPQIVRSVKPGGFLMASGILKSQAGPCLKVAESCGIHWDRVITKGKWLSAMGRRIG